MPLIRSDDLDSSPMEELAGDIIPRTGVGYVWGPPGAAKSLTFGIELGLAIANGTKFFGRPCRRGPVVYAAGEGLPGIGVRKKARLVRQERDDAAMVASAARDLGDDAAGALAAAMPAYTGEDFFILTEPFDVRTTAGAGEISGSMSAAIADIIALGAVPEIVIIDAAADFCGGAGLGNDSHANRFAAGLKVLAAVLDTCILVIAHPTASGAKMLGAGRLVAAADFVIQIQPDSVSAPGAPATSSVISRKAKDSKLFETFGISVETVTWDEPSYDDETGELTGQTEPAESATVRPLERTAHVSARMAMASLRPGMAKRNGIKRAAIARPPVPDLREIAQREYPELRGDRIVMNGHASVPAPVL